MTKLKTLLLNQHPFPEGRQEWGMYYEASDACRLWLDEHGWAHIVKGEDHAMLPAHAVRAAFAAPDNPPAPKTGKR